MQVVTVKDKLADNHHNIEMKTLFDESVFQGARAKFGTVTIPPRSRVPLKGTGSHEEDEYALVIKGAITTMSGGKQYHVKAGQATFIPAGEEHWAYNEREEDCEIIWTLVKR